MSHYVMSHDDITTTTTKCALFDLIHMKQIIFFGALIDMTKFFENLRLRQ